MNLSTVQEIERAIITLSPKELSELYSWIDRYQHPLDERIEADLATGRLDEVIQRALDQERDGQIRSL